MWIALAGLGLAVLTVIVSAVISHTILKTKLEERDAADRDRAEARKRFEVEMNGRIDAIRNEVRLDLREVWNWRDSHVKDSNEYRMRSQEGFGAIREKAAEQGQQNMAIMREIGALSRQMEDMHRAIREVRRRRAGDEDDPE